jgi:hypothetical protein
MTDIELFLTLAEPDSEGFSRFVSKTEFVGDFSRLHFTNGCNWMRSLKGKFLYVTSGRSKDWKIKLVGFDQVNETRNVKKEIQKIIVEQRCAHTGFKGTTQNPIEVDHKNGRYNDQKVLNLETQILNDFQPLCRQANLQKRSDCKKCKLTGLKFDAKELGYSISNLDGQFKYERSCTGCYWFDPIFFKKNL